MRRFAFISAALCLLAGTTAAFAFRDRSAEPVTVRTPALDLRGGGDAAALAVPVVPVVNRFRAGVATVASLAVFDAPGGGLWPARTLDNPTHEGFPLVVSVVEDPGDGWVLVRFPARPNGSAGWVRASELDTWEVPNRVVVTVGERILRVYDGDSTTVLFEAPVAVGAPRTPTPLGDFFVDIVNPLGGHAVYGWGQLSVSGFSEVLERFAGGIGQIAIHGWNDPSAMGHDVSNGCVRMTNDAIARVAELAPLGTPVQIVA